MIGRLLVPLDGQCRRDGEIRNQRLRHSVRRRLKFVVRVMIFLQSGHMRPIPSMPRPEGSSVPERSNRRSVEQVDMTFAPDDDHTDRSNELRVNQFRLSDGVDVKPVERCHRGL